MRCCPPPKPRVRGWYLQIVRPPRPVCTLSSALASHAKAPQLLPDSFLVGLFPSGTSASHLPVWWCEPDEPRAAGAEPRGEVSHSHPSTSQQRSWQRARWRKTLQLPPPPLSQQSPTSAPAPAVTHTAVPDLTPDELPRRTQPTLVPWRRRAWAGLPPLPAHGAGTKAINQGEPWLRSRAPRRRAAKRAAPCSINESFPKKHLPPSLLGGLLSSTWEYTIAQEKLESPSRSVCI